MKRAIRVTHFITSLERGGAQAVLHDLIIRMDPHSFTHAVVYIHDGPYRQMFQDAGIAVHRVTGWLHTYDPVFLVRLWSLLRKLNPDCLHTLLWMANNAGRVVAKLLGIPCVSALHNNLDQDGVARNLIDRITVSYADELVAVSELVAESLCQRRWQPARIDKKKVKIIHNGIDPQDVASRALVGAASRAQLGLSDHHFIIGSVGRFVAVKNYTLLLDSFAVLYQKHAQARLVLVGDGVQKQMLKAHALRLAIDHVVTFVEGQQAYVYYPLFDCFVQTSHKEGVSIALLEAMSFGCACVVTAPQVDHPVISSEKDGIVVPAGSSEHIVSAINDIIINQSHRECLGYNAHATVKKYLNVKQMTISYEKLFVRHGREKGSRC